MNTLMYEHPLTAQHLETIEKVIGYEVIGPIGKELACGDVGEQFQQRGASHSIYLTLWAYPTQGPVP